MRKAALGVLGALLCMTTLQAQSAAPAPLAAERAGFLRKVLSESQLLTEQYERALAKLESELAAASDYEEARQVQQRRAELRALYPAGDAALAQAQAIPLLPVQARLSGATEARGDTLTGWRTLGSAAEWSNLRLAAGRYYIEMDANLVEMPLPPGSLTPGRAQPQDRAAFEIYEVSLLAGAEENRRTFEITLNADDTTFSAIRVGPVNFTRSPVTLRLQSMSGYPGNLVRLRNPRLVPVTDTTITAAPAPPQSTSLEDARKSLLSALTQAQKPVTDAYLAQLRALAAEMPALRDEADIETKRVMKLLEGGRGGTASPLRLLTSPGAMGGFEDLDGVRLVVDAGNSGDRILVVHEGRRFKIHLLWMLCAPLDEKDDTRKKSFAKHFGIDADNTLGLARAAQEFTTGYLEGKPLRLLLRPGKDKDDSQPALIFLPEVGLYQNVLIDQGLAAVQQPQKDNRRGAMERALLGSLLEREQLARRQKTGAWALRMEDKR